VLAHICPILAERKKHETVTSDPGEHRNYFKLNFATISQQTFIYTTCDSEINMERLD
jgi:hypothetical protein